MGQTGGIKGQTSRIHGKTGGIHGKSAQSPPKITWARRNPRRKPKRPVSIKKEQN